MSSSWAIQGLFWTMTASTNPPSAAAWSNSAAGRVVAREADELRLARLADRLGDLPEIAAPRPLESVVEVAVAQRVHEDQVDVVGLERGEPAASSWARNCRSA